MIKKSNSTKDLSGSKSSRPTPQFPFPNIWPALALLVILGLVWIVFLATGSQLSVTDNKRLITNDLRDGEIVPAKIERNQFYLEVAATEPTRRKGLSNRESIPQNGGMVFVFGQSGNYPFTMEGMRFPLDIVFVENDKIVEIAEALPPGLPIFSTKNKFDAVLELNPGTVKEKKIKVGDKVVVDKK